MITAFFLPLACFPMLQHELDTVQICALLHPDGHAYVQEERVMTIGDEGTECYIKLENMGDMSVKLLDVCDESGENYVMEEYWEVERSRAAKAGRCGLVTKSDGYEICWGVGESGHHKYTLHYTISNLVKGHPDADGFNHCFYEASTPAAKYGSVYIMPYSELFADSLRLTPETARVWAFGFRGHVDFYSGNVAAFSTESFVVGDRIIVMMEFPKGTFQPEVSEERLFSDVKETAFFGSDYNLEDSIDGAGQKTSLFGGDPNPRESQFVDMVLGAFCCCGWPIAMLIYYLYSRSKKRKREDELKRREKDIAYVYEPPCGGRLVRSQIILLATLGHFGDLSRKRGIKQHELLQALILRMLYTGRITLTLDENSNGKTVPVMRIEDPKSQSFSDGSGKPGDCIDLFDNGLARQQVGEASSNAGIALNDTAILHGLHKLLFEAAGADHVLQPDELRTYVKQEQNTLQLRPYARLISALYYPNMSIDNVKSSEADEVYGFYKYLRDFTLMPERHIHEVALWQEFMVFAALFNLTEKVGDDLRRINPDMANLDELTLRYLARPMQTAVSSFASALDYSIGVAKNFRSVTERSSTYSRSSSSHSYDRGSSYDRHSGRGGSSSRRGGGGHSGGGGSGVR